MRRKDRPMKYHGFYCTDELWEIMQKCAMELDESDSEYIRGSIILRTQYQEIPANKIVIDDPVNHPEKFRFEKPTIPEQKEKVGEKPKEEFKTFFKK